jgi:MFS family permease
MTEQGVDRKLEQPWLTRGVLGVGTASLCSDASHEMVTSLLPTFLTSTLHAGPAALGTIDGISDALASVAKLAGGSLAAEPQWRPRIASGGYLGTALATAAIGVTSALWQVGVLRAFAWLSRGIRSPARDMILTDLAGRGAYGRAFGLERAGDNAGAILGPLLAAGLVGVLGVRHTILLAIIPGVLAALSITVAAREVRRVATTGRAKATLRLNLGELHRAGIGRVLVPVALFELGNAATTLLILRATDLLHHGGRSLAAATSLAVLLYAGYNAVATVTALAGGQLADRVSPRLVFALGGACFLAGYLVFAAGPRGWPLLLLAFALAGAGIGLAETAQSAVVAGALPDELRSNGFGLLGLVQALGDVGSTLVAGLLWSQLSATVAFGYLAAWMAASVLAAGLWRRRTAIAAGGLP